MPIHDPTIVAFGPVFIGVDGRKLRRAHWDGYFSPQDARVEGGMWIEIDSTGRGRMFQIASAVDDGLRLRTHLWFYAPGELWPISRNAGWSRDVGMLPFTAPPSPPVPPPADGLVRVPIAHLHHKPPWPSSPTEAASFVEPDPANAAAIVVPRAGTLEFTPYSPVCVSNELMRHPVTEPSPVLRDVQYYKRYGFEFPSADLERISVVSRAFEVVGSGGAQPGRPPIRDT